MVGCGQETRASSALLSALGSRFRLLGGMRVAGAFLLAASVFLLVVFAVAACGSGKTTEVGVTPGRMAPGFAGVTLHGTVLSSDGFRGRPFFLVYATSG